MDVCPKCGVDDMMCSNWVQKDRVWLCVCLACEHEWEHEDATTNE